MDGAAYKHFENREKKLFQQMMVSILGPLTNFNELQDLYDKQLFKKAMSNADEVLAKHNDHPGKYKQSIFKN